MLQAVAVTVDLRFFARIELDKQLMKTSAQ